MGNFASDGVVVGLMPVGDKFAAGMIPAGGRVVFNGVIKVVDSRNPGAAIGFDSVPLAWLNSAAPVPVPFRNKGLFVASTLINGLHIR
jgi:hypothetical protein